MLFPIYRQLLTDIHFDQLQTGPFWIVFAPRANTISDLLTLFSKSGSLMIYSAFCANCMNWTVIIRGIINGLSKRYISLGANKQSIKCISFSFGTIIRIMSEIRL